MTDPTPPELELNRPARPAGAAYGGSTTPRPQGQGVRSAARPDAPPPESGKRPLSSERLKEGAVDTLLNSISILGEVLEDFRNSDRYFKFKALVLTAWLALSLAAVAVAAPDSGPSNDIAAHLVVAGEVGDGPVYMVTNESSDDWQDVEILVNGGWRASAAKVQANGGSVTLSPAVVFDTAGQRAPPSLRITDIVVRVAEPEAAVVLLKAGVPQ